MMNRSTTPGRKCAWCGKPGGTCMSVLKARCDRAGVTLKGKSQRYFHPGRCVQMTRLACDRKEAAAGPAGPVARYY